MGYTKQAIRGVSWMGGLKLSSRALGFLRIFILARILVPEQFGVFGVASLVLILLEVFTETGINVFLIQNKASLEKYLNTAWVISISRGIFMMLVIFLTAPFISQFFNSPNSLGLITVISLVPFIKGFINPSIVKFQKNLNFKKEYYFRFSLVLVETSVAVMVALATRSVYALVLGILVSALLEVILSFVFINPKPKFKFNISQMKEILSHGKWVTMNGIWGYMSGQGDDAVVARLMSDSSLGYYQVAYRFSLLPGSEITDAVNKVTFPVFSKISDDRARLKNAYLKALVFTAVLTVPLGLILFFFSKEIILYSVGEAWLPAAEPLRVLALFGLVGSLAGTRNSLLYSVKRQDLASNINMMKAIVLAVTIIPLTINYGLVGAAYSSLISVISIVPITVYVIYKVLNGK